MDPDAALRQAQTELDAVERLLDKLACPFCCDGRSRVVNVRHPLNHRYIWRRRECLACHTRYDTHETVYRPK
jgi:transcription repressor NrdR-like protein